MKLLVITPFYKPAYAYGGPTRSIPALCEALVQAGIETTVFTTNANKTENLQIDTNSRHIVEGVTVYYFERQRKDNFFYSKDLGKACYSSISSFDIVYISSNWTYPFIPAGKAAYFHQIPFLITPKTSFMRETWKGKSLKKTLYHHFLERPIINKSHAIHYTTDLEKEESQWLRLKNHYFIVPNPVDLSEFVNLPAQGIFRRKYGIGASSKLIIYLGRVEKRKGVDIALKSFALYAKNIPDIKFVIAGPEEDGYKSSLNKIVADLNLSQKVMFTGYLDSSQRLEALVDSDLFILTSHSENFGMAVVEAMAAGVPVIVSDRVGIADHISQTQAGFTVPLNPELINLKIKELLDGPSKRLVEMGKNGELAAKRYSPPTIANEMAEHFKMIAAPAKAA